jgi:hypothetical protein
MNISRTTISSTQRVPPRQPRAEIKDLQPQDTFQQGLAGSSRADSWKSALVHVGKSAGLRALDGAACAGIRALAFAAGGPVVGQVTTVALIGAGAALGVMQDGERFGERVGEKTLGNVVGGVLGAGKTALMIGAYSGGADLGQSLIGGAVMGGTFGLIESL